MRSILEWYSDAADFVQTYLMKAIFYRIMYINQGRTQVKEIKEKCAQYISNLSLKQQQKILNNRNIVWHYTFLCEYFTPSVFMPRKTVMDNFQHTFDIFITKEKKNVLGHIWSFPLENAPQNLS